MRNLVSRAGWRMGRKREGGRKSKDGKDAGGRFIREKESTETVDDTKDGTHPHPHHPPLTIRHSPLTTTCMHLGTLHTPLASHCLCPISVWREAGTLLLQQGITHQNRSRNQDSSLVGVGQRVPEGEAMGHGHERGVVKMISQSLVLLVGYPCPSKNEAVGQGIPLRNFGQLHPNMQRHSAFLTIPPIQLSYRYLHLPRVQTVCCRYYKVCTRQPCLIRSDTHPTP